MNNQYKLFNEVEPFYQDMLTRLNSAANTISMMYLIYDDGQWAQRLNQVLIAKAKAGVKVRIIADLLGTICDHPTHLGANLRMIKELKAAGIEFNLFHPNGPWSTPTRSMVGETWKPRGCSWSVKTRIYGTSRKTSAVGSFGISTSRTIGRSSTRMTYRSG